jgi:streptogramin lyase
VTRLEDRLRDHFRDEVAGLDVPDLLAAVLAAGRRARTRRRVAAACTAVLMAGVAGAAIGRRGSAPQPAARHSARPFTVLTRTDLAPGWGQPSGIAAVPGGVWLSSWNRGQMVRIDAATGRIMARIPVGTPGDGPYSIAYGAGSLWVTDLRTSDLLRLDPRTGHRVAAIHLPGGIRYVTVGGGYVWVTTMRGGPVNNRLVKIDPATNTVLAVQPMPGNYGKGGLAIAPTSTAVWLLADGGPAVRAVNPASLHVVASARTGAAQYTRSADRVRPGRVGANRRNARPDRPAMVGGQPSGLVVSVAVGDLGERGSRERDASRWPGGDVVGGWTRPVPRQ